MPGAPCICICICICICGSRQEEKRNQLPRGAGEKPFGPAAPICHVIRIINISYNKSYELDEGPFTCKTNRAVSAQ